MVKVKHIRLDGYSDWKARKVTNITLPVFSVEEVIKYITRTQDQRNDPPLKREFKTTCQGQVINHMNEEDGELFVLVS